MCHVDLSCCALRGIVWQNPNKRNDVRQTVQGLRRLHLSILFNFSDLSVWAIERLSVFD